MKAGKSSATVVVFSSRRTNSLADSKVSLSVAMPRTSSTSSITGTGFMKWMPMNRSGRSVEAARRVIEIDEVLVARIASGFSTGRAAKNLALDALVFGGRLDDKVGAGQILQGGCRRNATDRRLALSIGKLSAGDLPRHIAVDGSYADSIRSGEIS